MYYLATYTTTYICYHASDMILNIDSDAAYLVAPKSQSRITSYFQINNFPKPNHHQSINGAIRVECKTLRHGVSSAAEEKTSRIYHNTLRAILFQTILNGIDHPQPLTPVKSNDSTTNGFTHDNIHQKRYKSWDMRYYWLRDQKPQK